MYNSFTFKKAVSNPAVTSFLGWTLDIVACVACVYLLEALGITFSFDLLQAISRHYVLLALCFGAFLSAAQLSSHARASRWALLGLPVMTVLYLGKIAQMCGPDTTASAADWLAAHAAAVSYLWVVMLRGLSDKSSVLSNIVTTATLSAAVVGNTLLVVLLASLEAATMSAGVLFLSFAIAWAMGQSIETAMHRNGTLS